MALSFGISLSAVYRIRITVITEVEAERALTTATKLTHYRAAWESALRRATFRAVARARLEQPAVYMWLYRNDREWLRKTNIQVATRRVPTDRVDWQSRDLAMSHALTSFISSYWQAPTPSRLSKSLMCRYLGEASIAKNLDKLPRLNVLLSECAETLEQYQMRRINYAIEKIVAEAGKPTAWRVQRIAGVKQLTIRLQEHIAEQISRFTD